MSSNMKWPVAPSVTSSKSDFDFLEGKWIVQNRKLKARLKQSNEWEEFESTLEMHRTLNGLGNIETYRATFKGRPFEGLALRLFNPETRLWSVYWVDSSNSVMDSNPVVGSFEAGVGKLYAKDTFDGKPVVALYQWDATNPKAPVWSQALSVDDGKTWEWNWTMHLTPAL